MFYLIGTDEAGYGPNLGPLAVTATLWRAEEDALCLESLFDVLAPAVVTQYGKKTAGIPIADSKKLHRRGTLEPLEMGIFASLCVLDPELELPLSSELLCDLLCGPAQMRERREIPWHTPETEEMLPRDLSSERAAELGEMFSRTLEERGVSLLGIRSELVFPRRFNVQTEACGSKGVFLSDTTLGLAVHFWEEILRQHPDTSPDGGVPEVRIFCDKHGGRNFYLPALMEHFPDLPFCVVQEGRAVSEYVHYGERAVLRIRFQAKGESILPTALASMVSKYLREVSMDRFNAWWRERIPGLTPTAGYPEDARRFRSEIAEKMEELRLDWGDFWRDR
ncbi:MAG: hypothetical protein J6J31_13380 [Thermoguttaceae bacterium]|nr:hypothetical protein [Thermoguttaceae bacterium]